jgi:hypothetical protein
MSQRLIQRLTERPDETGPSPVTRRARGWMGLLLFLAFLPLLVGVEPACQVQEAREAYGVEIVLAGQSWDEASLSAVMDALSRLPPHVVKRLGSRFDGRLHILCNAEARTLSGTSVYSHGANFYSSNEGRNEIVLYPNQGTLTVLHELGHAYQLRLVPPGKYAWAFFQDEMRDFMRATGWHLLNTDAEVAAALDQTELSFSYGGPQVWQSMSNPDPLEDYANTFALFFYDPERLRQLSPVRYDWMQRHVATDAR